MNIPKNMYLVTMSSKNFSNYLELSLEVSSSISNYSTSVKGMGMLLTPALMEKWFNEFVAVHHPDVIAKLKQYWDEIAYIRNNLDLSVDANYEKLTEDEKEKLHFFDSFKFEVNSISITNTPDTLFRSLKKLGILDFQIFSIASGKNSSPNAYAVLFTDNASSSNKI